MWAGWWWKRVGEVVEGAPAQHYQSAATENSSSQRDSVEMMYKRPCGLMDKALIFGTKDCRFESCQGQQL